MLDFRSTNHKAANGYSVTADDAQRRAEIVRQATLEGPGEATKDAA